MKQSNFGLKNILYLTSFVLLLIATPAYGATLIENFVRSDFNNSIEGLTAYEYRTGTSNQLDFTTGTHSDTVEVSGDLRLDVPNEPWWDTDWESRQCFEVDSATAIDAYPIQFEVNTSGTTSNGDDIRVVTGFDGALLDSYSQGPFPDAASSVWAKIEPLPTGVSNYCVYFDNPLAASVSSENDVFDRAGLAPVSYYTLLNTWDNRTLSVISYTDNNVVSDGTTTVTLNTGDVHDFANVNRDTVITATGPIEGSTDITGTESIIPESYASNEFIYPVDRGTNQTWIRSPFATTTVEAIVNDVVVNSILIAPGDGAVMLAADFIGDDTVTLRSTDGTDFLAIHKASSGSDTSLAVPWFDETVYGVRSRWILIGATEATNVALEGSNGQSLTLPVSDLAEALTSDATDARGNGTAFSLTSAGPQISAYQYADQNGGETTAFLPLSLLSTRFLLPVNTNYYTIACPVNGTSVSINGGAAQTCSSTNLAAPGFLYSGLSFHPQGTRIEADNPIYVYYETDLSVDEHNLLGTRGSIPYLEEILIDPSPTETIEVLCGIWTSDVLSTSGGVFGETFAEVTVPTGTTFTYQISIDGGTFVGPDGTTATTFSSGEIVDYSADFGSTFQVRVELCTDSGTSTPTVSSLSVDHDLDTISLDLATIDQISIDSELTEQQHNLLRVYQGSSGTWNSNVAWVSGTNIGDLWARFSTDTPTVQIEADFGTISDPSPTFTHDLANPYTLFVDHLLNDPGPATTELRLQSEQGVLQEIPFIVNFAQ